MKPDSDTFLEISHISKEFRKPFGVFERIFSKFDSGIREEVIHAVNDVSFALYSGEVIGLAGESGCGKSTLGRIIAGINKPTSGRILYKGKDVSQMNRSEFRNYSLNVQMIFQDPYASLNPRMQVREIVAEAPRKFKIWPGGEEGNERLSQTLLMSGLDPGYADRYPHQFSGGQRQRIGIARGLAVSPECLVCDETVASLDVSIQAQIINLFMELKRDLNLTYLFISHDLSVIEAICDRVLIMYLGSIVESSKSDQLFTSPLHPYTQMLLNAVPRLNRRKSQYSPIKGETPSPIDPPSGCAFHPRCPQCMDICEREAPPLKDTQEDRFVACHLFD